MQAGITIYDAVGSIFTKAFVFSPQFVSWEIKEDL